MDANLAFWKWILNRLKSVKGIVFFALTTGSAAFNLYIALKSNGRNISLNPPILYGTQAIIILIISAIIAFGPNPKFFTQYKRGSQAVQQFWSWWPRLWFSWFLLYVGLTFWQIFSNARLSAGSQQISPNVNHAVQIGLHQLNNIATLVLLMLFHLLAEPSISEELYPAEGDIFQQNQKPIDSSVTWLEKTPDEHGRFMFWIATFIALAIAEVGLVFIGKNADSLLLIFAVVYGILAASATALLVGQLTNRLLGVPTPVLVILFIYAGIQPSFDFILNKGTDIILVIAGEVIVVAALACKVVLFSAIQWLGMTNRLLYFMVENYSLYKRVDEHRNSFFQKIALVLQPGVAAASIGDAKGTVISINKQEVDPKEIER